MAIILMLGAFVSQAQQEFKQSTASLYECVSGYATFEEALSQGCVEKMVTEVMAELKIDSDSISGTDPFEQGREYGQKLVGPILSNLITTCDDAFLKFKNSKKDTYRAFTKAFRDLDINAINLLLEGGETVELQMQKAMYFIGQSDFDKAKALLETIVSSKTSPPQALYFLGTIYEIQGDYKAAIKSLQYVMDHLEGTEDISNAILLNMAYLERLMAEEDN